MTVSHRPSKYATPAAVLAWRLLDCPTCDAPPMARCRTANGNTLHAYSPVHGSRVAAFRTLRRVVRAIVEVEW